MFVAGVGKTTASCGEYWVGVVCDGHTSCYARARLQNRSALFVVVVVVVALIENIKLNDTMFMIRTDRKDIL